ncbi:MAG: hypothetical protein QOD74_1042 [Variibacter sp.]|nr:hypothetical protein [Variibacter sp.]
MLPSLRLLILATFAAAAALMFGVVLLVRTPMPAGLLLNARSHLPPIHALDPDATAPTRIAAVRADELKRLLRVNSAPVRAETNEHTEDDPAVRSVAEAESEAQPRADEIEEAIPPKPIPDQRAAQVIAPAAPSPGASLNARAVNARAGNAESQALRRQQEARSVPVIELETSQPPAMPAPIEAPPPVAPEIAAPIPPAALPEVAAAPAAKEQIAALPLPPLEPAASPVPMLESVPARPLPPQESVSRAPDEPEEAQSRSEPVLAAVEPSDAAETRQNLGPVPWPNKVSKRRLQARAAAKPAAAKPAAAKKRTAAKPRRVAAKPKPAAKPRVVERAPKPIATRKIARRPARGVRRPLDTSTPATQGSGWGQFGNQYQSQSYGGGFEGQQQFR